ncbi:MAG: helix-hairpin-helix domain-containing protein, partial [bacterium]
SWSRRGGIGVYEQKLKQGMRDRGYSEDFAERVFRQIMGFGEYGFPESHAASFALLVYVSAWLKCHEPAAFTAALINSLPMGFYAPAQLVSDAREHGVEVRPADVQNSDWDCTLELQDDRPVLRLGLRLVSGLSQAGAERISQERHAGKFQRVDELADRAGLNRSDLKALAAADALSSLSTHRHRASWDVAGVEAELPVLAGAGFQEQQPQLLPPSAGQEVLADYAHMGLSLRQHPLSLLRDSLRQQGYLNGDEIAARKPGSMVHAVGLVLVRQRPGKGNVTFVTLEDETGSLNLVIWQQLAERQRKILLGAKLLGVWAEIQRADGVQHLICRKLENHSGRLEGLAARSRDYH